MAKSNYYRAPKKEVKKKKVASKKSINSIEKSNEIRKKCIIAFLALTMVSTSISIPILYNEYKDDIDSIVNEFNQEYGTSFNDNNKEEIVVDSTFENTDEKENNNKTLIDKEEAAFVYDDATTDIAEFLDSMEFENDMQYFYAFYIYLNDGMFSENDNIEYNITNNYVDDSDILGFDCIIDAYNDGIMDSVCRHRDTLFNDVLNKSNMGFEAYSTPCVLSEDNPDFNDIPNHQISVVNYAGDTRYYDITNGAIADYNASNNGYVSTNDGILYYTLRPEDSLIDKKYITNHNDQDTINRIHYLYENDSFSYTDEEIKDEFIKAYTIMQKNQDLVNDFKIKYEDDVISKLQNVKTK